MKGKAKERKKKTEEMSDWSRIHLINSIISVMRNRHLSDDSIKEAADYARHLALKLEVSEDAAMIFVAFFDNFTDQRITINDIAIFYECSQVTILTYWPAIEELVAHKYLRQVTDSEGDAYYSIRNEVIEAIRKNIPFRPKVLKDLQLDHWISEIGNTMDRRRRGGLSFEDFKDTLTQLIFYNRHLIIADELAKLWEGGFDKFIIVATMINLYIQNNDEHIIRSDIEDMMESSWEMRSHARHLEKGTHPLQKDGLVENCEDDGLAVTDAWKLTNAAKARFLPEIDTTTPAEGAYDRNVRQPGSIPPKQLFFNPTVTKQLQQLENLLGVDRFAAVQESLARHGMRRGFACIFYGEPGTGKTESAYQIARNTGRALMVVDVPSLRSKWVGDTEKNMKALFDKYKLCCSRSNVAPILLFNEADAILCKRNEGAVNSVDKMENALQNIILQEMENLEGIMIATTNLTGNLDDAFERRFLYKVEFPKPTPNESKHIWHNMLPEISEQDALGLAKQYSFSGGQIENIVRKQIVYAVLSGEDNVNMDAVLEACRTELFKHSGSRRIGFY